MKLAELDILVVWNAVGGGPLRGSRGQGFWRKGDGWSISLNLERGTWYDHRDNRGGGALSLVETALGCNRRTALQWLEANCGLDSTRPPSPAEHRADRQERADAEHFGMAAQTLAEGLFGRLDACDPARFSLTQLLQAIRTGGTALTNEYRIWLDRNPELTRAMVRAGISSAARLRRRLAFYVVELANAA